MRSVRLLRIGRSGSGSEHAGSVLRPLNLIDDVLLLHPVDGATVPTHRGWVRRGPFFPSTNAAEWVRVSES
jgi:hypothetical protein